MPHLDAARRCPCCGVPLIEGETICSACRRKRAEATRQKIHQVLKKTPWISYEDCRHAVECDKMTFTDVKSLLGEWAMGKALDPQAKSVDKAFAVMLTRSLSPEQLSDERIDAIIEKKGAVGPMYLHLGNNYVIKIAKSSASLIFATSGRIFIGCF